MKSRKTQRLIYWMTIFLAALIIPLQFAEEAHAAISYVNSASTPADSGSQAGPGPVAVTPPAMQTGDFVLIIGAYRGSQTPAINANGGQTWTSLTVASGTNLRTRLFYCIFNGTWSANPSISVSSGTSALSAIMHVFRGVDSTTPLDVSQTTGTFTAPGSPYDVTITGITTNTDGAWVLAVWGSTSATGATWTLQTANWANVGGAQYRNTSGTDISISAAYKAVSPAGGSGDVTNRESQSAAGTKHILALKPRITTLGDGTDPSNSTVAPDGTTKRYLDQFTFVASSGTDSVTALTVTTANTTAIASVEIWNEAESTQYFSTVSSPSGNTWSFSGGTAIPVSSSSASFRVRFIAKSHAALAAGTYAVTGTVTAYTCTNSKAGTDTDSATITVDNSPPSDATWGTITPGDTQIVLNWTNPGTDFYRVVILRTDNSAVGDAPADGTEYTVGNTIGSSTVRYVGSLQTFTDTGLTNGHAYYYKIFAYDTYINYASGAGTGPYTPGEYRRAITIQSSKISTSCTSNISNYVLLVSLSGDWLKTVANGGKIENYGTNDPYDLIFRALGDSTTCDGVNSCNLDHEVEKWDGTAGTLVAWVRIPQLRYNTDTTIYVYYGNPSITSSTQNPTGVWNTGIYNSVWHLKEVGAGTIDEFKDSTSNGDHGTGGGGYGQTNPTRVDGKIGYGQQFNGSSDFINIPAAHPSLSAITVAAWVYVSATYDWIDFVMTGWGATGGWDLFSGASTWAAFGIYESGGCSDNQCCAYTGAGPFTAGSWHYLVGTYGGSGVVSLSIDGGSMVSGESSISSLIYSNAYVIGDNGVGGTSHTIDEVQILNTAKDYCWIQTTYNNQYDPSTFISVATSDESPAPTAVILSSFAAAEHEEGVLLEWRTGFEANNLGFNIYREEGGHLMQINPGLIKGSALMTGPGHITAGYSYSWWDVSAIADVRGPLTLEDRPSASRTVPPMAGLEGNNSSASSEALLKSASGGRSSSAAIFKRSAPQAQRSVVRYWLEDIDLSGAKTMHGPVTPVFSHKPAPKKAQSMLLSQINKQGAGGREQGAGNRRQESGNRNQESGIRTQRLSTNNVLLPLPQGPEGRSSSPAHGGTLLKAEGRSSSAALRAPRANIVVSSVDEGQGTLQPGQGYVVISDKAHGKRDVLQRAIAATPSVKIYIQEEGWYRVTQPELLAAGMDPAVNPRFLQLFVDGQEQPILVKGGRDDRLGSREAIEFYAQGLDTSYTDTRVYWLVPGSKPGKRIDSHIFDPRFRNPQSAIRNSFESFSYSVEKKDRSIYVAALKNGEASNFFGSVVSATPVHQVLKVSRLDSFASGDAVLEVSLQGVSAGAHQVMVMVNGAVVGTMAFEGQALKAERFPLVQAGLVEGENVVTLAGQGVPLDVSLVDSIRLTYWRTYTAEEDILKLTSLGGNNLSVNGFSSSSIRVVDITDLQNLKEVGGTVQGEGGGYSFRFRVPGQGQRTLLAFVDEEARTPAALELNQPSRWHQANQSADLVVISHGDFLESLRPLKAFRESQGLSVALIDVEDLYDEFSFGIKTPQALKDFLSHARSSWQKAPRFVLLVGDASFDPRNYYGFGYFDYVPTKLVDTNYIETASDDWFVDFNNDGLPDMAIGRIPVRTAEEAAAVVSKIVNYEQSKEQQKEVLLVADMKDKDFDYMAASAGVKAILPQSVMVSEVYRDQFPDDVQVKTELLRRLNQGPLLVNYIGHGTLEFWRGDIFGADDAEVLTNGLRLPFVIGMTCLTGFFHDVYYETLAESFLKAKNGGALAVWTSSGVTEPDKQAVMNKEMIRLLFNGQGLTIGEAAQKAKAATSDQDIRRTWILFGDPATRLKP